MNINDIYSAIRTEVILPTLGRQSKFTVSCDNGIVTITNSGGNSFILTQEHLTAVCNRYNALSPNDRLTSGQYNAPIWAEGVNLIFDPYIAKIIDTFLGL